MKNEFVVIISKLSFALLLSIFDPFTEFIFKYNPFFGTIGVFGNVITAAIIKIKKESSDDENTPKKKSMIYHVSTFVVSFGLSMMFSRAFGGFINKKFVSYVEIDQSLAAFIIGMSTAFTPLFFKWAESYIIGQISNIAKKIENGKSSK